jgi:hypothetical protein
MTIEHGEEALPGMLRALDAEGITMESIQIARPTLDDVFLTLTGRSLSDDSPAADEIGEPRGSAAKQTITLAMAVRSRAQAGIEAR